MADDTTQRTDELWLFPAEEIPEVAIPVGEASPEWREASMLKIVEAVRFNPERLADYESRIAIDAPGVNAVEFLDHMIECAGGRSQ